MYVSYYVYLPIILLSPNLVLNRSCFEWIYCNNNIDDKYFVLKQFLRKRDEKVVKLCN